MVVSEEFIWEKKFHQADFTMTFAFISSLWFILSLQSKLISSRSKPIISTPKLHGNDKLLWIFLNRFVFIFSGDISSVIAQMLQNHYFFKNQGCCLADVPFNADNRCAVPCMSSQGKLEIVPSKLSLLCPLVSLECVAKRSPDTAALSWELEFSPHRLKE